MKESKGVIVEFNGRHPDETFEGVTRMEWSDGRLYLLRQETVEDTVAVFKEKDIFAVRDYYE